MGSQPLRGSLAVAAALALPALLPASSSASIVAFTSDRAGTNDIYTIRPDGRRLRRVVSGPADDQAPAISPDRSTIAFISDRSGRWQVYTAPVRGGAVRQITDEPGGAFDPAFAPNGHQLAYSAYLPEDKHRDLRLVDLAGGTPVALTDTPDTSERQPAFSPDGQRLAYESNQASGHGWAPGHFGIWSLDLAGGAPPVLLSAEAQDLTPAWSPDGRYVMFARFYDRIGELWQVSADGQWELRLTVGAAGQPGVGADYNAVFSPDGRRILTQRDFAAGRDRTQLDLTICSRTGSRCRRLTRSRAKDSTPDWR